MIHFAKGLEISEQEYANQGNAILGIRDSGKSYTATWLAERLLDAGIPFVAFDPIGVWRNLKLPGTGKGYEVVVAGDDGDLPLTPESAPEIVRAAMRENIPLVIDLYSMSLSKADWKRIVEQCVRILLFENKRHGLRHVFIEEAAEFAPQRVGPDVGRVYAEIEKLARMGGNAGLGYTLINQRAEEVNKAILELCDCLFLHRQKGRHSLTALGKWLDAADATGGRAIIKSLPSLEQGECWVWPQGRKDPVQVKIPAKRSHHPDRRNLSATAAAAKSSVNVGGFVAKLQAAISAEVAKEIDPKVAAKKLGISETVATGVHGPDFIPSLERRIVELMEECERSHNENRHLRGELLTLRAGLRQMSDSVERLAGWTPEQTPAPATSPPPPAAPPFGSQRVKLVSAATSADPSLPKACVAILAVLAAHHPRSRSRASVALQAGYSEKGGGFLNACSHARVAGLLEGTTTLAITEKGRAAVRGSQPMPTGKSLVNYWLSHPQLGRAERKILEVATQPPRTRLMRKYVAVRAGYEETGGGFLNALSKLRTLGLIAGAREIMAAEEFFTGGGSRA